MTNLVEHFKCPICLEVPDGKVFQCKNGHTFCNQCSTSLKTCPQCRAVLGTEKIRNRTLEELLDMLEFNCPNKGLGCEKILKRHEISSHLKYCKFEPFYFCKLIGFQDCSHNAINSLKSKDSMRLLSHLRKAHLNITESAIAKDEDLHIIYENIISATHADLARGSVTVWTPHLVKYSGDGKNEAIFLFLCQLSEFTRNVAWICLSMTENSPTIVEYKIGRGGADKCELLTPQITWNASVMPFKDIEKELDSFALRVPFCVLNSVKESRRDLGLSLRFLQEKSNKFHDEGGGRQKMTVKELVTFVAKPIAVSEQLERKRSSCPYIPSRLGEAEEEDREEVVFDSIFCNECGQRPLTKIRYKCLQCIDYDLCRGCMDRGAHSEHVFARIINLKQNDFLNWKHRLWWCIERKILVCMTQATTDGKCLARKYRDYLLKTEIKDKIRILSL